MERKRPVASGLMQLLGSLPELQSKAQLPAPALIIVGEVVLLHENLAWFGEDVLQNHGLILPDAE